jgi:hypothetical protein
LWKLERSPPARTWKSSQTEGVTACDNLVYIDDKVLCVYPGPRGGNSVFLVHCC